MLNLVLRDGEIRNLPRVRGGTGGGDRLPFDRLVVHGARITLDADILGDALLEGVNLELDVENGREIEIELAALTGRWDHLRGTERLRTLGARAHYDPDHGIEVEHAELETAILAFEIEDAFVPLPPGPGLRATGVARVDLAHLADLPHGFDLPELRGTVQVDGTFELGEDGPTGEGTVTLDDAAVEQYGLNHVELTLALAPDGLQIVDGTAQLVGDGGSVAISGGVGFGEGYPLEVSLRLNQLELAYLLDQLGVTPNAIVQWQFDGRIGLRGTLNPLDIRGPLAVTTRDFLVTKGPHHERPVRRIIGVEHAAIRSIMSIRPDAVRFEHIVADTGQSHILADVMLGFDNTLHVAARGEPIAFADASPLIDIPIGGSAHARVEVTGTFQDPQVEGHVAVAGMELDTFPLGDIDTDFHLEEGGLAARMPLVTAHKNDSSYQVEDLFLDFRDDRFAVSGAMHTPRMTLSDFYQVFHFEDDERFADYSALFSGDAIVRYTLGYPGDGENGTMDTDLDLSIAEATVSDFHFTDGELRAHYRWLDPDRGFDGGELELEHLHLRKGDGLFTLEGRMANGGALDMTAAADRISIRDTEGIAERAPDLDGVYTVYGTIGGTTDVPRADLDVVMTGLSWGTSMLGDARTYVRLTDRDDPWVRAAEAWDPAHLPEGEPCAAARSGLAHSNWTADPPYRTPDGPQPRLDRPMAFLVCGDGLDDRIHVDLAIGRTLSFPLRGVLETRGLALAPFLREIDENDPLDGRLSARVELTGGALKNDTLSGRLTVSDLDVGQGNVRLANDGPLDVILDHGDFDVAHADLHRPVVGPRGDGERICDDGSRARARRPRRLELPGEPRSRSHPRGRHVRRRGQRHRPVRRSERVRARSRP